MLGYFDQMGQFCPIKFTHQGRSDRVNIGSCNVLLHSLRQSIVYESMMTYCQSGFQEQTQTLIKIKRFYIK